MPARLRLLTLLLGTAGLFLAPHPARANDPFAVIYDDQLIGTWTCTIGDTKQIITFADKGFFYGKCYVKDVLAYDYEGKWTLSRVPESGRHFGPPSPTEVAMYILYTYTRSTGIKPGTKDVDRVLYQDHHPHTITLLTQKGAEHVYTQLAEKPEK